MVRHIYMDDSGRSRQEDEPFVVEAAIIANLDEHLIEIDSRFEELAQRYLPPDNQMAAFSAKEIWHGTKNFHRDRLTREERATLLRELSSIPRDLDMPVVYGGLLRKLQPIGDVAPVDAAFMQRVAPPAAAFFACVLNAELWLRTKAKHETAIVIHEDTAEFRKLLRQVFGLLKDNSFLSETKPPTHLLPLTQIRDEVLFSTKAGSRLLQVADVCAFLIKRRLANNASTSSFFDLIRPQIFSGWRLPF